MPASFEYPKGDQLKMGRDPGVQTRWYDEASMQRVPYHIAGIWHCFAGREKVFNSSIDWQNMWMNDFINIAWVC